MSSTARRLTAVLTTALAVSAALAMASVDSDASTATPAPATHRLTAVGQAPQATTATRLAAVARQVHGTVRYAVNVRAGCARPASPTALRCFAIKREAATATTPGAYAYVQPNSVSTDALRGLKAADLATAYGYDPNISRSTTTVGIVDWNDDPHALSDLNHFDVNNGLHIETATSFRKVNQRGQTTHLPAASRDSAPEIALDIEAVRAVCHTCRILLVEADDASMDSIAAAENRAVAMHASIVSNSYGGPEQWLPHNIVAAYNHPGVVITASTGDDGWYGWDYYRQGYSPDYVSDGAASFPATSPDVVAVGGTSLQLNSNGTRLTETVWNNNGRSATAKHVGATGGGCSQLFAAPGWQLHQPGYSAAGCNGKRLAADIAADADPASGLQVYDTYGSGDHGNVVIGGTSLSSPLTAAMFALAGGSGGSAYAAASLYVNGRNSPSALFDVAPLADDATAGRTSGNSFCGGVDAATCAKTLHQSISVYNPNDIGNAGGYRAGVLDCTFTRRAVNQTAAGRRSECNTVTGYDGPTGLGTPKSDSLYKRTIFRMTETAPSSSRVDKTVAFTATATPEVAGSKINHYTWSWGDGTATNYLTYSATHHTFRKKGTFVVTLGVTDSLYQVVIKRVLVKVS
jgi:hypothetical protein